MKLNIGLARLLANGSEVEQFEKVALHFVTNPSLLFTDTVETSVVMKTLNVVTSPLNFGTSGWGIVSADNKLFMLLTVSAGSGSVTVPSWAGVNGWALGLNATGAPGKLRVEIDTLFWDIVGSPDEVRCPEPGINFSTFSERWQGQVGTAVVCFSSDTADLLMSPRGGMRTSHVAVVVAQVAHLQPDYEERCTMASLPHFHSQKPEYECENVLVQKQERQPLYFRVAHQLGFTLKWREGGGVDCVLSRCSAR